MRVQHGAVGAAGVHRDPRRVQRRPRDRPQPHCLARRGACLERGIALGRDGQRTRRCSRHDGRRRVGEDLNDDPDLCGLVSGVVNKAGGGDRHVRSGEAVGRRGAPDNAAVRSQAAAHPGLLRRQKHGVRRMDEELVTGKAAAVVAVHARARC